MTTDCEFIVSETAWAIMTIAQEARSESFNGKLAVAEVIRNRRDNKYFSDGTVRGTVLFPLQFSGWNTYDKNRIICAGLKTHDPITIDCLNAWNKAISENTNLVNGAVLYYAKYIDPPAWSLSSKVEHVAAIGAHIFFRVRK